MSTTEKRGEGRDWFGAAVFILLLVALVVGLEPAALVTAAFPGTNGKIAFQSERDGNAEIYVMNADGTNQTRLTYVSASDIHPAWSPDGTKIAFESMRDGNLEIYVMNADGSSQTRITFNSAHDVNPSWSPDGARIVFTSVRDGNNEIYVMNADGSGQTNLTRNPAADGMASWSPDGTRIAFMSGRGTNLQDIYTMNADGSGVVQLTNNAGWDWAPDWSPDGLKIAFGVGHAFQDNRYQDIWVMNADGTGQVNLTNDAAIDAYPAWSPDGAMIVFERQEDIYAINADGSGRTNLTNYSGWRNRDPSWQPVVPQVGTVTIVKVTDYKSAQSFPFTSDVPGHLNFELIDDGTGAGNSETWTEVLVGTYKIAEALPPRWTATSVNCGYGDIPGATSAKVNVTRGGEAVCTFVNHFINTPPVANDDSAVVDEDQSIIITVLGNDIDVDGDLLVPQLVADVAHGALTANPDRTYSYQPALNWNGVDGFDYRLCDEFQPEVCNQAAVSIIVNPVNDPPVVVNDTATGGEDSVVFINVLVNDSDIEDELLTLTAAGPPAHGTVVISDGGVEYQPAPNYNGNDGFNYTVCDASGGCSTGLVSLVIGGEDDVPVAVDDQIETDEDQSLAFNVAVNDYDVDGNLAPGSVQITQAPVFGAAVAGVGGVLTYSPDDNANGTDSFAYTICDNTTPVALCDSATVAVTVRAVNDPPAASADSGATETADFITIAVLANDTDVEGDVLSVAGVTSGEHGTVVANLDGTVTYTRDPGFNGSDTFSYIVSDGEAESVGIVSVQITPDLNLPADVDLGENVEIAADVSLQSGVTVGDAATIGSGATVQTGAQVGDGATIGEGTLVGQGATIGEGAAIGAGSEIKAGADVGSGATLGDNVIINQGATIGEDAVLGPDVMLMQGVELGSGVTLGEGVKLGKDVWIGDGVTIGVYTQVKDYSVIGAGAIIGAFCQIGNHVTIGPNLVIADDTVINNGTILP